ncbi:MAG: hypothetical protein KDB23_27830, partial [Planctomycetales bacterium]|nr:hypothetical protein [Planctomycetales bacterium]
MMKKRFGWNLELRHLFLLVVIAATLSDVFLRPPPQRQQFGNLIIESNYDENSLAETGPWRLTTPGGQTLVLGHHNDQSEADETWTYFHSSGRRLSLGSAAKDTCVDTWTTWYPDGTQLCQATFISTHPSQPKVIRFVTGSGSGSLIVEPELLHVAARQGEATWFDDTGKISQRITYDADKIVSDLEVDPVIAQIDFANVRKLVNSQRFKDRRMALRMLRRMGVRGLPILQS